MGQRFRVFHFQGQRIESFFYFFGLLAVMATKQVDRSSGVEILHYFLQRMAPNERLKPTKEHRNELLDILLDHHVHRLAERLVRSTKIPGCEIDSGCFLEVDENPLQLME